MARKTGSHSGITGPKVREAATRLFTAHGYATVSMRQIAAEVGVQAGALYLYTPNKQTLLFNLLVEQMEGAVATLSAIDTDAPATTQLEAFVRSHIQYHMGGETSAFIPYTELRNLTPKNYEVVEVMRHTYEASLERILEQGRREKAFEIADCKLATLILISVLNGVLTWYRPEGRVPLQEVENYYVDIVRKTVQSHTTEMADHQAAE